jgi:AcrR family transcriptional regulator
MPEALVHREVPKKIRRRARSEAAKKEVREKIIAVGRQAFATQPFETVSLRGIAAAAGYSPSVMYRLYEDRQALFLAIREADLERALQVQERLARRVSDPEARIQKLFVHTAKYWLANEDQYQVLYCRPRNRAPVLYKDGSYFGQSQLVARGVSLWENALRDLFDTYPAYPTTIKLAVESILIALHAVVSVPSRLRSREWTTSARLAKELVDVLICGWRARAQSASGRHGT